MFIVKDLNGEEYLDDEMTEDELDILSGLYRTFTGKHLPLCRGSHSEIHTTSR